MRELVVAIPTFRRPGALATALSAVREQVDAENDAPGSPMHCSILVVDNDPAGSGGRIAAEHAVRYVIEPRPGIAAVRNRAIAECEDARAVLFIDDDEVPEPGWLRAMIGMYRSTGPAAVAGRVVTRFPDDVEPWVAASGAFIRPTRVHGQTMGEAATNNLLVDLDGVRRLGLAFDERFGLTGGSDSMFTLQLARRGGSIRWAEDAVVIEQEDPKRFTRSWVLMRTFRFGNTSARVRIALAPTGFRRAVARWRALGRGAGARPRRERAMGLRRPLAFAAASRTRPADREPWPRHDRRGDRVRARRVRATTIVQQVSSPTVRSIARGRPGEPRRPGSVEEERAQPLRREHEADRDHHHVVRDVPEHGRATAPVVSPRTSSTPCQSGSALTIHWMNSGYTVIG